MDKFVIKGPSKIKGDIRISGTKNAALPILAATLLLSKPVELKNVPNVRYIQTMLNLLRFFKKKIKISKNKNTIKIYNSTKIRTYLPYSISKTMRGSIICLGWLVSMEPNLQPLISTPVWSGSISWANVQVETS